MCAIAAAAGVEGSTTTPAATEASSPGCLTQRTASFPQRETTEGGSCASSVVAWTKWPPPKGTLAEAIAAHGLGGMQEQGETCAVVPGSCSQGAEMGANHWVAMGTAAWPSPKTARSGRMGSEAVEIPPGGGPGGEMTRATGRVVEKIGSGHGQVGAIARIA